MATESTNSELDMGDCCSKCKTHDGPSFSASELALTAVLSFIAGVSLIILVLVILRLERDKKMCFRKKEEPFRGKFEGASKKATFKVLKKHTLERSSGKDRTKKEDQTEEIQSANESPNIPAESALITIVTTENEAQSSDGVTKGEIENSDTEYTNKIESKETHNEQNIDNIETEDEHKIERDDTENNAKSNNNDMGNIEGSSCQGETNEHTDVEFAAPNKDLLRSEDTAAMSSQLFEKSRGSSVYEHGDLVLQNDNFRISTLSNI